MPGLFQNVTRRWRQAIAASALVYLIAFTAWGVAVYQTLRADLAPTPTTVTFGGGTLRGGGWQNVPTGDILPTGYQSQGVTVTSTAASNLAGTLVLNPDYCTEAYFEGRPSVLSPKPTTASPIEIQFSRTAQYAKLKLTNRDSQGTITVTALNSQGGTIATQTLAPQTPRPWAMGCPPTYVSTPLQFGSQTDPNVAMTALRITMTGGSGSETPPTFGGPSSGYTLTSLEYLTTGSSTPSPSSTAVRDARLTLSKTSYSIGETVAFTVTNSGNQNFGCGPAALVPYKITRDSQLIYEYTIPTNIGAPEKIIRPGESVSSSWDQKDQTGRLVTAGTYVLTVTCASIVRSAVFVIGGNDAGASASPSPSFTIHATSSAATATATTTSTSTATSAAASTSAASVTLTSKKVTTGSDLTLRCGDNTILIIDWGDGTVDQNRVCPADHSHRYSQAGSYTVRVFSGTALIASGKVVVTEAAQAGGGEGGSARTLVATGGSLAMTLLIATLVAGLVTYFVIRRPLSGGRG